MTKTYKFNFIPNFLFLLMVLFTFQFAFAQRSGKKEKFLEATVSPNIGLRFMGNYNMPSNYYATNDVFRDSLRKADRPGQSLNFGIQYLIKKNAYSQFSVGLTYVNKTFKRVRTKIGVGDVIHPDIGIVAGLIQAGILQVDYNFNYKYIEGSMLWHKNVAGNKKSKESDFWVYGGFAPSFLISDKMKIKTVGFTIDGKNNHYVSNPQFKSFNFNVDARVGFRLEQFLFKGLKGLVQPNFRMPILPAFHEAQTIWIPQLGLDVGISYKI